MTTRIRLKDITLNEFHKDVSKHNEMIKKNHRVTNKCRESRWPYTDQLSFDQILLMRDTYAGPRKYPTALETKHPYDRIFPKETGWDQRVNRDDRHCLKVLGTSGRTEDHHRTVPMCSNAAYGKRYMKFYDKRPEHIRVDRLKSFKSLYSYPCTPPHMWAMRRILNESQD